MFDKRKEIPPVRKDSDTLLGASEDLPNPTSAAQRNVRTAAVIGSTITIKGDITGDENLVIEGKVDGTVNLNGKDVTVGEAGKVSANVSASVVRIDGEVEGDIEGLQKVVISRTGRVKGNIVAPRVQLDDGALFRGSIDMNPAEPAQAKKAAPAKPAETKPAAPAPSASKGDKPGGADAKKEPGLTLKSG